VHGKCNILFLGGNVLKEYKFVKSSEGLKGIQIGGKKLEANCNILIEKYALEGWRVFQFVVLPLEGTLMQIIFERDKQ